MDKKTLMQAYNNIAEKYGGYRRASWPALKDFLRKDVLTVDIGCGNANYLKEYLEKGYDFVGFDFSFNSLLLAKLNKRIQGDAVNLLKYGIKNVIALAIQNLL